MKQQRGGTITVTSGVSASRCVGFVQIHWNGEHGQLTPDEARAFGLSIIAAAEAAEFDCGAAKFMGASPGNYPREASMLLSAIREQRGSTSWSLRSHADTTDPE